MYVTTRDELHARIDHLSDEQVAELAALLDAVGALPPDQRAERARQTEQAEAQARAQVSASATSGTPLPSALEALGDYVGAWPGFISDLINNPPDPEGDPVGAALVDDQRRELAGLGKREWRALSPEQKAAAVAANAARWR